MPCAVPRSTVTSAESSDMSFRYRHGCRIFLNPKILAGVYFMVLLAQLSGCAVNRALPIVDGQQVAIHRQTSQSKFPLDFWLYIPQAYESSPEKYWPLLVFLHGSGERGTDLNLVKSHGPPKIVQGRDDFPFVVLSPQLPKDAVWQADEVNALIDQLIGQLRVDPRRIYLTGLSLGGHGTWDIASARPERFAAIAPVCGKGQIVDACRLKEMPVWAFHGAADQVVRVEDQQRMVDAVHSCGGQVKFTIYPGVGHDSWTSTYDDPELYAWLLQQQRADGAR